MLCFFEVTIYILPLLVLKMEHVMNIVMKLTFGHLRRDNGISMVHE